MYKIGEFSALSKTTIKTIRYYEKEGLLKPCFIDEYTGYRYYETSQLDEAAKIISLRKIGLSIKEIKYVLDGGDLKETLNARTENIRNEIRLHNEQLLEIDKMLKEIAMNQEIKIKQIPSCTVYYKEGVIEDYSKLSEFILQSGEECYKLNPDIQCVEPDYCFVNYLNSQYKEKNIKIRYSQAVVETEKPFNENGEIKFRKLDEIKAVCIYHKGSYDTLGKSYSEIMKYIEEHSFEISDYPRECYIDGIWNKDDVNDWLTEIQVPIK